MARISPQKGKRPSALHIWIQCVIWLSAVCMMAFAFCRKAAPVYTEESLNSVFPLHTPAISPGESVSQTFRSSHDRLHSVGIALSYQDDVSDDASVLFQVLSDEELVLEQTLSLRYCPNSGFCTLILDLRNCQGKAIAIRIKNTSQSPENAVFSLLATDKDYLYLDNVDNYLLNGEEQDVRLLLASSYMTGYSYYTALTCSFWVLLVALIASGLAARYFSVPIIADKP